MAWEGSLKTTTLGEQKRSAMWNALVERWPILWERGLRVYVEINPQSQEFDYVVSYRRHHIYDDSPTRKSPVTFKVSTSYVFNMVEVVEEAIAKIMLLGEPE